MITLLILAADQAPEPSATKWTYILSIAGVLCGLAGAYLGYRGQSKSASAAEVQAIFDGQDKLIHNLESQVDACAKREAENSMRVKRLVQRIENLESTNDTLRSELERVLSDFSGLRMIVQDEIARAAAEVSEGAGRELLQRLRENRDGPAQTEG